MKLYRLKTWVVLAAMLGSGLSALAQYKVPGPDDYADFSKFVTDRNIFDPSRQPHDYNPNRVARYVRRTRNGIPGIQFVGTMSYEKGMFAFFNANDQDLKKATQVGDKIAGYAITQISANDVVLESADKKQQLDLKIGDGFRQENGAWVLSTSGEISTEPTTAAPAGTSGVSSGSSASSSPAAPPSTGEPNDVLKRLMQLREKNNK